MLGTHISVPSKAQCGNKEKSAFGLPLVTGKVDLQS